MTDTSHQMNQDRANLPERIELARRTREREDDDIILVFLPHRRLGRGESVTWAESHTESLATYHGHYFGTLRAALEDYESR